MEKFGVKTTGLTQKVSELSGGNQQKLLLARWLLPEPQIIILDEPTRGIDVGSKHDIYEHMNELIERGCSIIMISSELPISTAAVFIISHLCLPNFSLPIRLVYTWP